MTSKPVSAPVESLHHQIHSERESETRQNSTQDKCSVEKRTYFGPMCMTGINKFSKGCEEVVNWPHAHIQLMAVTEVNIHCAKEMTLEKETNYRVWYFIHNYISIGSTETWTLIFQEFVHIDGSKNVDFQPESRVCCYLLKFASVWTGGKHSSSK